MPLVSGDLIRATVQRGRQGPSVPSATGWPPAHAFEDDLAPRRAGDGASARDCWPRSARCHRPGRQRCEHRGISPPLRAAIRAGTRQLRHDARYARTASSRRCNASTASCGGRSASVGIGVCRPRRCLRRSGRCGSRLLRVANRGELANSLAPAFAHRVRRARMMVGEEQERARSRPSSPMNSSGICGRQQQQGGRGLQRFRARQRRQPFAEGAVADLVVVLQESNKGGGRQVRARLAARLAAAMAEGSPWIDESFFQRSAPARAPASA